MRLMQWMRMTERQTTNANSAAQGSFISLQITTQRNAYARYTICRKTEGLNTEP